MTTNPTDTLALDKARLRLEIFSTLQCFRMPGGIPHGVTTHIEKATDHIMMIVNGYFDSAANQLAEDLEDWKASALARKNEAEANADEVKQLAADNARLQLIIKMTGDAGIEAENALNKIEIEQQALAGEGR